VHPKRNGLAHGISTGVQSNRSDVRGGLPILSMGNIGKVDRTMLTMTPARKRKAAPRPKGQELKRSIASFKGSADFAEWINGLAVHSRLTISALIEHALVEYAQSHGYEPTPPER
jgi:hypothetical protein